MSATQWFRGAQIRFCRRGLATSRASLKLGFFPAGAALEKNFSKVEFTLIHLN